MAHDLVEVVPDDAYVGHHPNIGVVFQGKPQGARTQGQCLVRACLADHHREVLALVGRFAFHVDELRRVRHRVEDEHELGREMQRQERLLAGPSSIISRMALEKRSSRSREGPPPS